MVRKFFVVDQDGENKEYVTAAELVSQEEARLETDLLFLLSELSVLVDEITETKDKQPVQSLKILSEAVNRVAEFCAQSEHVSLEEGFLPDALLIASGSFAHLKLLHVDHSRISAQTAINLYGGWTGDANGKNQAFQQISLGMVRVLELYFSSIEGSFNAPYPAQLWKETFEIYIKELTESVMSITFR